MQAQLKCLGRAQRGSAATLDNRWDGGTGQESRPGPFPGPGLDFFCATTNRSVRGGGGPSHGSVSAVAGLLGALTLVGVILDAVEEVKALGQQNLQLIETAALAQHVPVGSGWLHRLGIGHHAVTK